MSNSHKPSHRIDWFDGTVIEEPRQLSPEASTDATIEPQTQYTERKLMGFKRLLDLSVQDACTICLELLSRTSFWELLQTELKGDYIVIITRIIAKLCIFLQSGFATLLIRNLLKHKFLPSRFIETLHNYLLSLSTTRIANKRLNMLFWNDLESFYSNVLEICKGICFHIPEEAEKVEPLLKATSDSVHGVMVEHRETFTQELFNAITNAENILTIEVRKVDI